MTPDEFDSFAYGFDLNSASYSGGAGGTFQNLVEEGEDWKVDSATPTFSTQAGIEGMEFNALDSEVIHGQHRAMREYTILAIAFANSGITGYIYGGEHEVSNTFGMAMNTHRVQAYIPFAGSGYTAAASPNNVPHVWCISVSPENGSNYAQLDDGAPVSRVLAAGEFDAMVSHYANATIGRHKTTGFDGWIGRVLVFDRALHYRDNTNLQSLITSEMALVGL